MTGRFVEACRTGGQAANRAAKLCSLRANNYASWITTSVYDEMNVSAKVYNGQNMWEKRTWTTQGIDVYRSVWRYTPS